MTPFAAWVTLRFETMQEQADFNTTTTLAVLGVVVFKTVIDLLILRLVVRQANDVRVVMGVATRHATGTTRQIEDTDRRVLELHRALIAASAETKGKIEEVRTVAEGAACRLEQKIEEKVGEVKKSDEGGK